MNNKEEFEKVRNTFIQVSNNARNQLTALCITLIAAIYFFSEKQIVNIPILKVALVFLILTILFEALASFLKTHHYAAWIEGKIHSIDASASFWGKAADILFWGQMLTLIVGIVIFFIGIFK